MAKIKISENVEETRVVRFGVSRWGVKVPFQGRIKLGRGDALGDLFAEVEMTIDWFDGVLQPTTVRVTARDGVPLTGTMLRQVPVRGMANELIFTAAGEVGIFDGTVTFAYKGGIVIADEERERIRLQGPTDESLRMAADLYQLGRAVGLSPAKFVETNLGMPRTTVTKWIRRARNKGLIEDFDGEH